ncbi:MAG: T9SS type A sorting domain-containing protein [Chitinophagales bacterium]|nr:T9SS type A sorting domain-containing protein [Chitinophagales bacterium]
MSIKKTMLPLLMLLLSVNVYSQTTLALGDIAFTGYNSDPAANSDEFSFVILKSTGITSGTTIYFTDRGWKSGSCGTDNFCTTADNASFPESGSEFVWTSGSSLGYGTHVKISGAGSAGTFTCSNGSASGAVLNLSTGGDQIFALQNGSGSTTSSNGPSGTMLAAIHANKASAAGCSFSTTNWDDCTLNISVDICQSASNSNKPACLTNGTNALVLLDGSSLEVDNGVYNCTGQYSSTAAAAITATRTAVNTTSNWTTNDASTVTIPPAGCNPFNGSFITNTTWNGSTWNNGAPTSSLDAVISSNTTPGNFTCKALTISSGAALTMAAGTTANINGNITNSGNGFSGTGTFNIASSGSISGNAISCAGTVTVASGATLTTNGLLTLTSDATNTGRIGNSAGSISGNVQVQRYIPGSRRAYRFFSHPFTAAQGLSSLTDDIDITGSGGSTNGFTTTGSNNPSAYWYDVSAANGSSSNDIGWTAFTSTNGTGANSWDQYEGIRVLVRGAIGEGLTSGTYTPSAVTLDMTGAVNQGSQAISVTKGSGTTYALVGNPFPSPVSMDGASKTAGIGSNFYVWSAQQGTKGGYTTYTYGSSSFNLPVYGAFVTQISSNGTITFDEADKTSSTSTMFKTTGFPNRVTLNIEDSSIFWDRLQLHFDANALAINENTDALKFPNPEVSFNTYSTDDSLLAIDNRPYAENETIPLGFTTPYKKNYKIVAADFDVPAGTKLFLKDNYTGKNEEISAGYEYWFTVDTNAASQGKGRFELNTQGKPTTGIAGNTDNAMKVKLAPNPAGNDVTIYYEGATGKTLHVTIVNMAGTVVAKAKQATYNAGSMKVSLNDVPAGVYIVNIRDENRVYSEKLIKQ